jgi:hypothetical protein
MDTEGDFKNNPFSKPLKKFAEKQNEELKKKFQSDFERIFNAGLIGEKIKKFPKGKNVEKARKSVADLEKKLVEHALEQNWDGENKDTDIKNFCRERIAEVFAENKLRSKKLENFLAEEVCFVKKEEEPKAETEREIGVEPEKEVIKDDTKKNENKPHFEAKDEKKFEEELKEKNIKSREELMAYLKSLKNTYKKTKRAGTLVFPVYADKVENVLNKKIPSNKIEVEELRDIIEEILIKEENISGKTKKEKEGKEIVGEDSIAESVNKIKTAGELLDYLKNLNAPVKGDRGGLYYFPSYAEKVKKALEGTMEKGETIGVEVIKNKIQEILSGEETNDESSDTLDYVETNKKDFEEKKSGKIEAENIKKESNTGALESEEGTSEALIVLNKESEKPKGKEEALVVRDKKDEGNAVNLDDYKDYKIEKIESSEEKEKARKEKENELIKEVIEARKLYARKHYENTSVVPFMRGESGAELKENGVNFGDKAYIDYKNKLNELLSFKLEILISNGSNGDNLRKEMGDLVKYFNSEEKTKLFEAKTNVRSQIMEEKFGKVGKAASWLMKGAEKLINKNRKLGWKKQGMVTVGLWATGLGLYFGLGRRLLGSVGAGLGAMERDQMKYRQKKDAEAEAKKEEMLKKVELEDLEKKFEKLQSLIKEEIDTYEDSLKEEEMARNKRLLKGLIASAGVLMMGKILTEIGVTHWAGDQIKHFSDQIGLSGFFGSVKDEIHSVFEKIGLADAHHEVRPHHIPKIDTHSTVDTVDTVDKFAENLKAEVGQGSVSTIEKGSNPWETARKHYEEMGMNRPDADKAVGNLFEKYEHQHGAKVFDDVSAGSKIIIGEDGNLEEFQGKHLGYLPEHSHAQVASASDAPKIIESVDSPSVHAEMMPNIHETAPTDINSHPSGAETVGAENASHPAEVVPETHTEAPMEKPGTGTGVENIATPKINIAEIESHMGKIIDGSDVHGAVDKYLEMEHQSSDKISQIQDYIQKKTVEISGIGTDWKRRMAEDLFSKEKLKLDAEKVNQERILERIRSFRDDFSGTTNSLRRSLCNIFRVENWSDIKSVTVEDALKAHPEIADQLGGISHSEEEAIDTFTRRLAIVAASKK